MQQRPLGRAGLLVSRFALGTMTWGADTDPEDAAAQLKTYVEVGGNLIDTADVYGEGMAEEVIGSLLAPMSISFVLKPSVAPSSEQGL